MSLAAAQPNHPHRIDLFLVYDRDRNKSDGGGFFTSKEGILL